MGCSVVIGNEAWMAENGAEVPAESADRLQSWKLEGKSVALLAVRQDDATETSGSNAFKILVLFAIADPLRPDAKAVVSHLQAQRLATWMISGDNVATAKSVAKQVGIPESNVIAGVLPHEKVRTHSTLLVSLLTLLMVRRTKFVGSRRMLRRSSDRSLEAYLGED
jgi:cation transport ATPase